MPQPANVVCKNVKLSAYSRVLDSDQEVSFMKVGSEKRVKHVCPQLFAITVLLHYGANRKF